MSVGQVRFPRWIEVCGRRIYVPEDQLVLYYMEERLPIDFPAYCPSETSITFPNDADASLIRLGAMRIGRMWLPTVYKTRPGQMECRYRGSIYTRNFSIYVHYTVRYCQRKGANTRNIVVDLRIAEVLNQAILRRAYLRWLRRYGISMKCLERTPETTQRRLIMMFYVWYLSTLVKALFYRLTYFITRYFYGVQFIDLSNVYIAWGLTTRTYARNYVYGQYCRCDATGVAERCVPVVMPYRVQRQI
jgi:hypothetical protein